MSGNSKTVSIVVPTRNRFSCVTVLIDSLLTSKNSFQLVIADNSDSNELSEYLKKYSTDKRLVYKYDSAKLSVVENFNRALDLAGNDYIAFLGDDDMLSAHFFDVIDIAATHGADAVICGKPGRVLHYFWPGVTAAHWGDIGGKLYYSNFSGNFTRYSHQKAIRNAVSRLGSGPCEMPRAYLGVISRRVVEKVKAAYGPVFGGCSPDVYSSHLIAMCCEKAFICDYPFIIPGASPKSTSAQRAERSDVGGLTDNDHLGRFANMKWDNRVPRFYAPFTVWAQSHLEALEMTHYKYKIGSFAHLYAKCLIFARGNAKAVFSAIGHHEGFGKVGVYLLLIPKIVFVAVEYILEKIPVYVKRKPGGADYEIGGCSDILQAVQKMDLELAAAQISVKE